MPLFMLLAHSTNGKCFTLAAFAGQITGFTSGCWNRWSTHFTSHIHHNRWPFVQKRKKTSPKFSKYHAQAQLAAFSIVSFLESIGKIVPPINSLLAHYSIRGKRYYDSPWYPPLSLPFSSTPCGTRFSTFGVSTYVTSIT